MALSPDNQAPGNETSKPIPRWVFVAICSTFACVVVGVGIGLYVSLNKPQQPDEKVKDRTAETLEEALDKFLAVAMPSPSERWSAQELADAVNVLEDVAR